MDVYLKGGFFHFLSRISPFVIPLYSFLYGITHNSKRAYLFSGGAVASDLLNYLLKQLIYPICSQQWYPRKILGTCARPNPKAKCSSFKEPYIFQAITDGNSYGMPSGHAQFAAFTAVYWSFYLYDYNRYDTKTPWLIAGLVCYALFVAYSRVVLSECHTRQQVIIGSLIGVILGWIYYGFTEWFLKRSVELPPSLIMKNI